MFLMDAIKPNENLNQSFNSKLLRAGMCLGVFKETQFF